MASHPLVFHGFQRVHCDRYSANAVEYTQQWIIQVAIDFVNGRLVGQCWSVNHLPLRTQSTVISAAIIVATAPITGPSHTQIPESPGGVGGVDGVGDSMPLPPTSSREFCCSSGSGRPPLSPGIGEAPALDKYKRLCLLRWWWYTKFQGWITNEDWRYQHSSYRRTIYSAKNETIAGT